MGTKEGGGAYLGELIILLDVFFVFIKVDGPMTLYSGLITGADQGAYKYKRQFTVFFIQVWPYR